jgi:hypothetical protein
VGLWRRFLLLLSFFFLCRGLGNWSGSSLSSSNLRRPNILCKLLLLWVHEREAIKFSRVDCCSRTRAQSRPFLLQISVAFVNWALFSIFWPIAVVRQLQILLTGSFCAWGATFLFFPKKLYRSSLSSKNLVRSKANSRWLEPCVLFTVLIFSVISVLPVVLLLLIWDGRLVSISNRITTHTRTL